MRSDLILFARDIGSKDPVLSQKELKRIKLPLKRSSMLFERLSFERLVFSSSFIYRLFKFIKTFYPMFYN